MARNKKRRFLTSSLILRLTIYSILFLLLFLVMYFSILKPAYVSTVVGCELVEQDENADFVIVGTTSVDDMGDIVVDISENIEGELRVEVLKHEQCHVKQLQQGRVFGCNIPVLRYTNEVECYVAEELSGGLFIPIYGNYTQITERGWNK